jgi:flagellar motor switch protein FliM
MADDDEEEIDNDELAAAWAADVEDDDDDADGDDLAAEWEAMSDDDDDNLNVTGARVLNQNEIDSLLGFQETEGLESDKSGIEAIIDSGMVSYERLPMLEVVFDRLVRMLSTSLRNFTSDNVEVSLDNITSIRFGDYLNSIPLPAMLAVFKAEEWDNFGLLTVDSSLIYSIVDVLLGGRRGTAAMRIEGRPYTTIERNLVERMITVLLADLSAAFDPLSSVTFRFDRLETNPRFATIARPANAAIVARLRVDMEDRGGRLELMLPYATLEPVHHLATELWFTKINLEAVLDRVAVSLHEVLNWKVGSRLELQATPKSMIGLKCGDVELFRGQMGRNGDRIAVRVAQKLET